MWKARILGPALRGGRAREEVYLAYRDFQRGLSDGEWKLILYHVGGQVTRQLFHLKADPWELENLAERAELRGRVEEMTEQLRALGKQLEDPAGWV